ncbi:flagellar basal body P-ring formation chaperone FlgA [uncultured Algimonas sp.]|uniref:flagellar basal body P-ring formation chaperone FlgA n=1 Tax=uncultured Algimonas sp. TaxID=1547920 RepID=UPI00261F5EC3|nr:flagellar basal body P-ring formation chaperone FlgA [uncultured Algimonas sp.]
MARFLLVIAFVIGLAAAPQAVMAADADQSVTTRALQRGAILREGDVSGPHAVQDYVGLELVRSVRAGAVLSPRNVRTPLMVKRNETVTLIYRQGPLTMETMGRSLGEGSQGDRISVMNTSSRKRITGRIAGEGLVEVTS